ncbi:hypothetical protein [Bradyrhizobium diversitatis]|uniref:Restriction system protein Mrr-like N-terminal domain-containing protein n=1 Tax=Bradyrhizobium diversitatis TaxID=2755406 RepID=A0ABS0P5U4_9BRAD|nr:hypothetical protein [Bradyrhizobium diversitatis]MBH5388678.1 hypothetical protein [Bradyrhizobium diversitatis]
MNGENVASAEAAKAKPGDARQRSTIGFPYMPLKDAVELVEAIHGNVGLGECDDDQLAAWSGQSTKSSGFRVQISSARQFGLITSDAAGRYRLTDLGRMIVDPNQAREAKALAFLNVPLYKGIFEKYRGGVLPSQAAALEREMVGMGVSDKVKDRARQTFERSAEQAGYFEHGKNRLVMPAVSTVRDAPAPEPEEPKGGGGGNGGGLPPSGVDPIIQGLLVRLPPSGSVWAEAERNLWLELLKGSFQLIYKDKDPA